MVNNFARCESCIFTYIWIINKLKKTERTGTILNSKTIKQSLLNDKQKKMEFQSNSFSSFKISINLFIFSRLRAENQTTIYSI